MLKARDSRTTVHITTMTAADMLPVMISRLPPLLEPVTSIEPVLSPYRVRLGSAAKINEGNAYASRRSQKRLLVLPSIIDKSPPTNEKRDNNAAASATRLPSVKKVEKDVDIAVVRSVTADTRSSTVQSSLKSAKAVRVSISVYAESAILNTESLGKKCHFVDQSEYDKYARRKSHRK